jgi:lipooligosaccharide transport system permease protein
MRLPADINLAMAKAVWWRNATVYRRTWKMGLLPNFFEPLLYLVGMGLGLGFYVGEGISEMGYIAFIGPGLLASAAMNGSIFEVTYNLFIKLHFDKLYDAYLSTPAQMQDVAFGELLWAVTRACIYGTGFLVVLVGMTLLGYPILTSPWALLMPLAMVLIGAAFGLIGMWFSTFIRTIDLYSYFYTLFITPLFLFSGIFFPVDRFPYGEAIAWCTPLYHGVRLMRGLAAGQLDWAMLVSTGWLVALCVVLLAIVPGRMRRMVYG